MPSPSTGTGSTDADHEVALARGEIATLSQSDYTTADAECDVIMKGGITSGVVYPLTICKLATRYRLRSIGGTSAGAIAAAMAAAAEHRRRHDADSGAGFRRLATLPLEVSKRLAGLFQPPPHTRGLYRVLFAAIDPDRRGLSRNRAVLTAIVAAQVRWFTVGVAVAVLVTCPGILAASGWPSEPGDWARVLIAVLLTTPIALVAGAIAACLGVVRTAQRVLPEASFGLTDGSSHDGTPALTDWLADEIDAIAGSDTACLTLGDLWGGDAVAAWQAADRAGSVGVGPPSRIRALRAIDFQVMTTNLTLRRPFMLPFDTQEFLFSKTEMQQLFPERVVATMAREEFFTEHAHPETGERLHRFPGPGARDDPSLPGPYQLPVIVMVRMSLSFPGLISAVPLYALDFNGDQSVVRHLFSDGGISSNFPMHFFDTLLPTRPTFGTNLTDPHPLHLATAVWRPGPTSGGVIPRARPVHGVGGFLAALRDTMQNWADYKQVTQRGYADRVVEIRLGAGEGGLNLRMSETNVLRVVARGALAGDSLLEFDWEAHRAVRYRSTMARLNDALDQMRRAWITDGGGLYPEHIARFPTTGPASSYLGGSSWRARDLAATDTLINAIAGWEEANWVALDQPWPQPAPSIRMAPE